MSTYCFICLFVCFACSGSGVVKQGILAPLGLHNIYLFNCNLESFIVKSSYLHNNILL